MTIHMERILIEFLGLLHFAASCVLYSSFMRTKGCRCIRLEISTNWIRLLVARSVLDFREDGNQCDVTGHIHGFYGKSLSDHLPSFGERGMVIGLKLSLNSRGHPLRSCAAT